MGQLSSPALDFGLLSFGQESPWSQVPEYTSPHTLAGAYLTKLKSLSESKVNSLTNENYCEDPLEAMSCPPSLSLGAAFKLQLFTLAMPLVQIPPQS